MYLNSGKKSECSGCTACMKICPKNAIRMVEDEEGFLYPEIEKRKCINCGACYRICPNIKKEKSNIIQEAYGVKHKVEQERMTSRSGGVFIALSDYILDTGGIVYGAKFMEDFTVEHTRATNKEERDSFKGSKYIQSNMKNIIEKVQKDLQENKKVLFSGTPCQVAGVKSAIPGKYHEQLYTCDLICHGVPSGKVFKDFLKYIEKISKKKIKQFDFRDKSFGWETHYETTTFYDGSTLTTQYFRNLFYGHCILRPACHCCNYANSHRPGDITIADFWGIDKVAPDFLDKKGVSLVMINNTRGKEWFEAIKDELYVIHCSIKDCVKHTYTLSQQTPQAENRNEFWEDYQTKDFDEIIEKYGK